jgi:hypothetical protein|nr:MAG TPA: homing endonuclease [Bacteriophage sp.]
MRINRLVAKAFISNPENKPQVNHIDFNRENNCVNNLEWVTAQENTQYSVPSPTVLAPHFPIAPPNPRDTIATENNAIYSLGTQQRSGEKKQETKIQRYRNVHTIKYV